MKQNMSTIDRWIRTILAVVIGVLFYTGVVTGTWGLVLMVIALILLVTAIAGVCPLYMALGIKTLSGPKTSKPAV